MSATKTYGTAEAQEEGAADQSYDIDNTYYVKERELSGKEKCAKFMLVLVPILAAVLLVGGFTFYVISHVLERGGAGGHGKVDVSYPVPSPSNAARPGSYPAKHAPAPSPEEKKSTSSGSSACSANIKCADLGLVGDCCPTKAGVTLGCCD